MSKKRIDIVHKRDRWIALGKKHRELDDDESKETLVERTVRDVRKGGKATTLRIHKQNGHLQEERSYPHAAPGSATSKSSSKGSGKGTAKGASKSSGKGTTKGASKSSSKGTSKGSSKTSGRAAAKGSSKRSPKGTSGRSSR